MGWGYKKGHNKKDGLDLKEILVSAQKEHYVDVFHRKKMENKQTTLLSQIICRRWERVTCMTPLENLRLLCPLWPLRCKLLYALSLEGDMNLVI